MKIEIDISYDKRAMWWYAKGETPNARQMFKGDGPTMVSAIIKAATSLHKILEDWKCFEKVEVTKNEN